MTFTKLLATNLKKGELTMVEKQVKWCAARSRYSTKFHATHVENAECKSVFVERGKKSFASYDKADEDAQRLTKELNCAQWEFSRLVSEFSNKAAILANDQTFFPHGLHSDTKETIYAAINMLRALADNMVSAELSERLEKADNMVSAELSKRLAK